jgi:hypothetical protein
MDLQVRYTISSVHNTMHAGATEPSFFIGVYPGVGSVYACFEVLGGGSELA